MTLELPTGGFLVRSGVQRNYKQDFASTSKRRGFNKAFDAIVIRLSNLLSIPIEDGNETILNKLFINMCNDDDIIFMVKEEPGTTRYELIKLFKEAYQAPCPITYIRTRVELSPDKQKLLFHL